MRPLMLMAALMLACDPKNDDTAPAHDTEGPDTSDSDIVVDETIPPGDTGCPQTWWFFDGDGDGYGLPRVLGGVYGCRPLDARYVTNTGDCDDTDPTVHPGAPDASGDGVDSDCDGAS